MVEVDRLKAKKGKPIPGILRLRRNVGLNGKQNHLKKVSLIQYYQS